MTVNDYLARRDAAWMGPIYDYLGARRRRDPVATWTPRERQPVYACDIVYGTNNEFGFDYLRDNMKDARSRTRCSASSYYAIVDEVDSILIDEARTPLIISGPGRGVDRTSTSIADDDRAQLERDVHYEVKEKERLASPARGRHRGGREDRRRRVLLRARPDEDWPHYIENALRAHYALQARQGVRRRRARAEVIIVDEFTGRQDGRAGAGRTACTRRSRPRKASPSAQRTRRSRRSRSRTTSACTRSSPGMTGTAITEAGEFHKIYKLDVVSDPDQPADACALTADDIVFRTETEKWKAIVDEIDAPAREGPARAGRHDLGREVGEALGPAAARAASSTRCSTPRTTSARRRSSRWPARRPP